MANRSSAADMPSEFRSPWFGSLALLTIATATAIYLRTAVSPLQEVMRMALGASDQDMALLQGPALAIPVLFASIPIGLAIDRYNRVRLLALFSLSAIVANLATAAAPDFTVLVAARCLSGLSATAVLVCAYSLVADLCAPEQRGRASMILLLGQFAGMALVFGLGGQLAGIEAGSNGWREALIWLTIPALPILFTIFALREPVRTGVRERAGSASASFGELWLYRWSVLPLMTGVVFIEVASGATFVWAAPALTRSLLLGPDAVGTIMSIAIFAGGSIGSLAGGFIADLCQRRGGPRRTLGSLSLLALASALPAIALAWIETPWLAAVLLMLLLGLASAIIVAGLSLFTIIIPNELRGLALSIMVGANTLFGIALAPMLVSSASGFLSADIISALAIVAGAGAVLSGLAFAAAMALYSAGPDQGAHSPSEA